jgi:hypothetical protein
MTATTILTFSFAGKPPRKTELFALKFISGLLKVLGGPS